MAAQSVVITGSTQGLGFGYAREFVRRGHQVVVSGRGEARVKAAVERLGSEFPDARQCISGFACEISELEQVRALWDHGVASFGRIDIWLNNAGYARTGAEFADNTSEEIEAMVRANVIGSFNAAQTAVAGMARQGGGKVKVSAAASSALAKQIEAGARAGAPALVGLRLRGPGPAALRLEAHPPLLQRVEGSSRWGAYAYRPVLFRQGRNTTREHRLVLALWGRLLAEEQQAEPYGALRTLAEGLKVAEIAGQSADAHLLAVLAHTQGRLNARKGQATAAKALERDRKSTRLNSSHRT